MGEYFFGLGRGVVADDVAERIDGIAKAVDAECSGITRIDDPGDGPRYWFARTNSGAPFDARGASAVIAALEAEGLWPVPTVDAEDE